jgi:Zn-dependent protease with chaperone function
MASGGLPPAGHVSFFDEQARRRRGTWRLSLACLVVASGIGIVLSAAVTPLLMLLGGGLLNLAARLGLAPGVMHAAMRHIGDWAAYHLGNFDRLIASLDRVNGLADLGVLLPPLAQLSPLAVPALIAAAIVWLALRALIVRAGGEDLIHRLNARPANPADREEHQLSNIVEELAIAAGLPVPRLMVIDSPMLNAAAVGRTHRDAAVLVTRGLLDQLDRSETSAVVGHMIASIGGGDIKVTASVLAVFQAFGFFLTVLDLPFRWSAWWALGGLVLVSATPRPSPESIARAGDSIEAGLGADTMPDVERMFAWVPFQWLRYVLLAPLLPPMLISMLLKLVLFLWTAFFLGPPLSLLWRNRRYMADAKAVELTRDPDALARALTAIAGSGVPPGGELREYFFISAPATASKGSLANRQTMSAALHPPLGRRIARLVALGADPAPRGVPFRPFRWLAGLRPGVALVVAALLALLVPLFAALFVMIFYLTALAMTLALAAGLTLVAALFAG